MGVFYYYKVSPLDEATVTRPDRCNTYPFKVRLSLLYFILNTILTLLLFVCPGRYAQSKTLPRYNNDADFKMATFSSTPIVIDGKGHLLGRLASIIFKQILWPENCCHEMWGDQYLWELPKQSAFPGFRHIYFVFTKIPYQLCYHNLHGSSQNPLWSCCFGTSQAFRRCATTIWQEVEDGRTWVLRLKLGHKYCTVKVCFYRRIDDS